MKSEIIRLLKSSRDFLSGQDLSRQLGVSRTAVWKIIKQLQSEGYRIEAVQNRGYRLVESGDVMTAPELKSCITGNLIGRDIICFEETDSTNARAKHLAEEIGRASCRERV